MVCIWIGGMGLGIIHGMYLDQWYGAGDYTRYVSESVVWGWGLYMVHKLYYASFLKLLVIV